MIDLFKRLFKTPDEELYGAKRSTLWSTLRKRFLEKHPYCEICWSKDNVNVHHIEPFHLNPEKELDENNLITLCENGATNHHLMFGHLGHWKSFNQDVVKDVRIWREKIRNRP